MRIEDMKLFARVAATRSFTAAARELGVPKQTLSRRIADLEDELGAKLLHRTTRDVRPTQVGAAYAERCAEVVRLAEEANRAVSDAKQIPSGLLRVTADPVFGEAFLGPVIVEHARRWPDVQIEVVLTRRKVELVEEGFDVAFRVGRVDDGAFAATRLGPARIRYCASPAYLAARGEPRTGAELASHDCVVVGADEGAVRWPVRDASGSSLVPVRGRIRVNSSALAREAALAGLGIALFPEFACVDDVRRGRLVPVLARSAVDVGAVWVIHATNRYLSARVRTFVELAIRRLGREAPWVVPERAIERPTRSRRARK